MRFVNLTLNAKISMAISAAEVLLHPDSKMMKELVQKNDFKFNSGPGLDVVLSLVTRREPIEILFYKSLNPWSAAVGNFGGEAIHFNSRKFSSLSFHEVVGCLLHEYSHYCGFNHGTGRLANYKTPEKCQYSVPYFLSENVKRWI